MTYSPTSSFIPDLVSCMEAYEYFIHDQNAHFWEEAVEHCKRNGTILAVLDTQAKLDELSRRLTSQGYKNWHRFWIGLVFNASIRQFVWSSGATVNVTSINNTCDNSFYSQNRCFLLRRFKSNCFQGKACDQRLLIAAGFICQPTVQKGIYFRVQIPYAIRLAKRHVLLMWWKSGESCFMF